MDTHSESQTHHQEENNPILKYWPLFALIIISAISGLAISFGRDNVGYFMPYFMGMFLTIFSLLKIFNPIQFADGFQMYDLVAKKYRIYALSYPAIELFLGLGFLSFLSTNLFCILTIIIMSIGTVGVVKALKEGLKVNCACMGTVLNVPLSTVTLTEDIGMIVMSLFILYRNF